MRPCRDTRAALVGYVEYPVVGLTSGLAPLSTLDRNATMLLDACIVPGTGPAKPLFSGRLVRLSMVEGVWRPAGFCFPWSQLWFL